MGNPFEDEGVEDTPEAMTDPEYTPEQIKGASTATTVWMVGLILIVLFVIFCLTYKLADAIGIVPWS